MRLLSFGVLLFSAATALAQSPASAQVRLKPDTTPLRLGELHRAAEADDPRVRELDLLQRQGALRDQNIAALRLPVFNVESQAQYQTDVPLPPVTNPGGSLLFQAPKATYDA